MERQLKQFRKFLESYSLHYNKVSEDDINLYIKELQEKGKKASSISRAIASIRSFYQYALKRKKVKRDPTANVKSPKIEKRVPSVLTAKEVELLLDQPKDVDLKGTRDKAMLEFAYATGMRVTEIISLDIDDVNLEEGYVTCRNGNKERTIYLNHACLKAISEYLQVRPKQGVKVDKLNSPKVSLVSIKFTFFSFNSSMTCDFASIIAFTVDQRSKGCVHNLNRILITLTGRMS